MLLYMDNRDIIEYKKKIKRLERERLCLMIVVVMTIIIMLYNKLA